LILISQGIETKVQFKLKIFYQCSTMILHKYVLFRGFNLMIIQYMTIFYQECYKQKFKLFQHYNNHRLHIVFIIFLLISSLHVQANFSQQDSVVLTRALKDINTVIDSLSLEENSQLIQFEKHILNFKPKQKIKAYRLLAYKLKELKKTQLSLAAFDKALTFIPKSDRESRASLISEKAELHFYNLQMDEIIAIFNDALDEKPEKGSRVEALIYMNRGRAYYENGDYQNAMNDYMKAKYYFDKKNVRDEQFGVLLHFIGSVFKSQNHDSEALKWYKQIIELGREINSKLIEAEGLYLSADIYNMMGDLINDLQYSLAALEIYKDLKEYSMQELMYMNISHYYMHVDDWDLAKLYLDSSYHTSTLYDSDYGLSTLYRYYAKYYSAKGNYKKAIDFIDKAYDEADKSTYKRSLLLGDVFRTEAWIHYDFGQYKKAFESLDDYQYYWEKLINEQNSQIIHDLEARYQNEKKKKEIELLNKEKILSELALKASKQRSAFLIIGLILASIFILVIINRYRYIRKQKKIIEKEKQRSDELLLNILPAEVAEELKETGSTEAKMIEQVSVLFTDFKGFTQHSASLSPEVLVSEINECFSAFDEIMEEYGIEKIKTIGDAYMAAGGLPVPNKTHVEDVIEAAFAIQEYMDKTLAERKAKNKSFFEVRIGVHTGPVVAGIVGIKKFAYDIWGDTVNTASRMESNGEAGKVNISEYTYELLKNNPAYTFENRGKIKAKGKGELSMFFIFKK
jgi:adenylate cyclase